jgi:hypothetical protein
LTKAQQADLRVDAEHQFAPEAFKVRADIEALRASVASASANYLQRYVAKVPTIPEAASKRNAALKKLRDGVA